MSFFHNDSGEVTLEDFIAFAQKKTWGQEDVDPFHATENLGTMAVLPAGAPIALPDEELADDGDSDGEDARCTKWD